eukprot:gene9942-biopygen12278
MARGKRGLGRERRQRRPRLSPQTRRADPPRKISVSCCSLAPGRSVGDPLPILTQEHPLAPPPPWGTGHWRGHGVGVARANKHFWLGVARAWRGRGAGVARAWRGHVLFPLESECSLPSGRQWSHRLGGELRVGAVRAVGTRGGGGGGTRQRGLRGAARQHRHLRRRFHRHRAEPRGCTRIARMAVRIYNFARRTYANPPASRPDPGLGQGQPSGGADNIWLASLLRRLNRVMPIICCDWVGARIQGAATLGNVQRHLPAARQHKLVLGLFSLSFGWFFLCTAGAIPRVTGQWRGRGAGYRPFLGLGGAGVARAWRGRGAGMSCDPNHLA